jgi:hypothetical protein
MNCCITYSNVKSMSLYWVNLKAYERRRDNISNISQNLHSPLELVRPMNATITTLTTIGNHYSQDHQRRTHQTQTRQT